ncbi:hypothetical protein MXD59_12635 [Frankia sp. Ag45/Mut15]|uniref:Uncharacterized protein n=1 Tax=Frankia umida TaxID=573489 RepID=A0ABT0JYJ9_9ACTN|nr:hypothetical protein [Frankia umida]MCK9876614.1 hypothetical protein [Frankia umida]
MPYIFTDHTDLASLKRADVVVGRVLDANAKIDDWLDCVRSYTDEMPACREALVYEGRVDGGRFAIASFSDALGSNNPDVANLITAKIREHRASAEAARRRSCIREYHLGYAAGCDEIFNLLLGAIEASLAAR